MEILTEPLQYTFIQRALLVSLITGAICPLIGIFVVTRGQSFIVDAIAHASFPGLLLAIIVKINPWFGMLPAALVTSVLVNYITRKAGILMDTSIAVIFALMFSLGVIVLSIYSDVITVGIEDILLGQILAVSNIDIYWLLSTALVIFVVFAIFFHKFIFISFDPVGAEVSGINVNFINYILLALVACVVIISVQAVGVILSVAILITPAATALNLSKRISRVIPIAVLIGIISMVLGLYASYYLNLPTSASMAVMSTLIFGCSVFVSRQFTARYNFV